MRRRAAGLRRPSKGYPLAASLNKDEPLPATRPRNSFSSKACLSSPAELHRTLWFSNVGQRRSAPVTHQDQGRARLAARWAPGCVCSPRKPSVPHRVPSRGRTRLTAQFLGYTARCSNPLWLTVRARRTLINLGWDPRRRASISLVLPTLRRHCRRRPIDHLCSFHSSVTRRPWLHRMACRP